jgi:hypothetical protein
MTTIQKLETFIRSLSKKDFHKYLMVFMGAVAFCVLGASYYVYRLSTKRLKQFEVTTKFAKQSAKLIQKNEQLQEKEERIKDLLAKNKDFNISIFFENLTNKHSITPEPNWKPETEKIEGSDDYEEIILQATFPNQTTEKLVAFLQDIYEEKMVYFKDLILTKEKSGINCTITLATKKYKAVLEE